MFRGCNEEELIAEIEKHVIKLRESLAMNYNIYEGENKDYAGLCYKAIQQLFINMRADGMPREHMHTIHGEQRHSIEIPSADWFIEHTWGYVIHNNIIVYIDPTSQQFKKLYHDIPDYYVSTTPPRWYLPDSENIIWKSGIIHDINEKIQIRHFGIIDHLINIKGFVYDTLFHHN